MPRYLSRLVALAAALMILAGLAHANPDFWKSEWPNTDFEMTTVESWTEILSGGPPKDGIPAVDGPSFINAAWRSWKISRLRALTWRLAW